MGGGGAGPYGPIGGRPIMAACCRDGDDERRWPGVDGGGDPELEWWGSGRCCMSEKSLEDGGICCCCCCGSGLMTRLLTSACCCCCCFPCCLTPPAAFSSASKCVRQNILPALMPKWSPFDSGTAQSSHRKQATW